MVRILLLIEMIRILLLIETIKCEINHQLYGENNTVNCNDKNITVKCENTYLRIDPLFFVHQLLW